MNRTGLFIALGLSAASVLLFALIPDLDLRIARIFFDAASATFPLKFSTWAGVVRDGAMWICWGIAAPSIVALFVKLVRPDKPLLVKGRTVAFLLITLVLSAGIFSNLLFKGYWGRPRPASVTEFSGPWTYKNWWDHTGDCPRNCSFFSGEAATAFWTYAPAALTPPQWRPLAYAGATVFGLATGLLRMTFGGHFLSDVVAAGLATFLIVWLVHGLIYRWPRTRESDEDIDARLTRFAWPGYALVSRWLGRPVKPGRPVGTANKR